MTPRVFVSIFIFAVSALSASCATTGPDGSPDWYAIGANEGRLGARPQEDHYASRFSTPADRMRYLRGWEAGFAQRPTPVS